MCRGYSIEQSVPCESREFLVSTHSLNIALLIVIAVLRLCSITASNTLTNLLIYLSKPRLKLTVVVRRIAFCTSTHGHKQNFAVSVAVLLFCLLVYPRLPYMYQNFTYIYMYYVIRILIILSTWTIYILTQIN